MLSDAGKICWCQRVIFPPPIATRGITCATWSYRGQIMHPSRYRVFRPGRISTRENDGYGKIASSTTDCRINNTTAVTSRLPGRPVTCYSLPAETTKSRRSSTAAPQTAECPEWRHKNRLVQMQPSIAALVPLLMTPSFYCGSRTSRLLLHMHTQHQKTNNTSAHVMPCAAGELCKPASVQKYHCKAHGIILLCVVKKQTP